MGPRKIIGFVLIGGWSDVMGEFFGVNRDFPETFEVFSLQLLGVVILVVPHRV